MLIECHTPPFAMRSCSLGGFRRRSIASGARFTIASSREARRRARMNSIWFFISVRRATDARASRSIIGRGRQGIWISYGPAPPTPVTGLGGSSSRLPATGGGSPGYSASGGDSSDSIGAAASRCCSGCGSRWLEEEDGLSESEVA